MDLSWLQKRVTVAEAEAAHMVQLDRLGSDPIPFGFCNGIWKAIVETMQDGDELWEFCSPPGTWANLAGREGIALVRNGKVINGMATRLS